MHSLLKTFKAIFNHCVGLESTNERNKVDQLGEFFAGLACANNWQVMEDLKEFARPTYSKYGRGPKLEGCAFANFGISSEAKVCPSPPPPRLLLDPPLPTPRHAPGTLLLGTLINFAKSVIRYS